MATEVIALPAGVSAADRQRLLRDRVWRFLQFRDLSVPKLRDILTNPDTLEVYRKDPFNPHAIARLRLSAYQKSIVMKYIDNLLDWGDSLFAQSTRESVAEAHLLYILASDILGDPPQELGPCSESAVAPRDYQTIAPSLGSATDFLIEIETFMLAQAAYQASQEANTRRARYTPAPPAVNKAVKASRRSKGKGPRDFGRFGHNEEPINVTISNTIDWKKSITAGWESGIKGDYRIIDYNGGSGQIRDDGGFTVHLLSQVSAVFCVPENKDLLEYWRRVNDRLNKIRHCEDLTGAVRELALFAPEIDPRLLVRARAAGISLEDVLNAISGNLPPYRFSFLIDRAKAHAIAVQGFGAALLAGIEKRDAEELSQLRLVHQQNIQKMTGNVRRAEIRAAEESINALDRQKDMVTARRDHLTAQAEENLNPSEQIQLGMRSGATVFQVYASVYNAIGAAAGLVPQVGAPTSMKWGGAELNRSMRNWGAFFSSLGAGMDAVATAAGLTASFERRLEGWEQQREQADLELKTIAKNRLIAEIRRDIAVRALDIHEKSIEQLQEQYEFASGRFSNLGLYTWLSATLQATHRAAYGSAFSMARLAEQAYRFERGDDTPLLQAGYWDSSKAGLLAGERLVVDLQNMERRFFETNYRSLEIDQAFSLTQLDPLALTSLRENGTCTFEIGEIHFNLFYPGHYRRRIKSVRLTIPCITGPYTNVSATLTLTGSRLRPEPVLGAAGLVEVPLRRSVSVAASTAQNDAGVFEFSFRDERYMPFEGAGAVSRWQLSLPKNFRQFDYETINDVILHVSYTAEQDGVFRDSVEAAISALEGTIRQALRNVPIPRSISLRQDFSSAFHRLLHNPLGTECSVPLTERFLPVFLRNRQIQVAHAVLALRTAAGQTVNGFSLAIDGRAQNVFAAAADFGGLWTCDLGDLLRNGLPGDHTFVVQAAGDLAPGAAVPGDPAALDDRKLLDTILYVEFSVA
jgi:hypothetical protein